MPWHFWQGKIILKRCKKSAISRWCDRSETPYIYEERFIWSYYFKIFSLDIFRIPIYSYPLSLILFFAIPSFIKFINIFWVPFSSIFKANLIDNNRNFRRQQRALSVWFLHRRGSFLVHGKLNDTSIRGVSPQVPAAFGSPLDWRMVPD